MSYRARIALAAGALAVFLFVVATQGVLFVPSYNPAQQQISEYVHTPAGALMTIGFLAWAASWATLAGLPPSPSSEATGTRRRIAAVQRTAFIAAGVGLALAACFATDRGIVEPGVVVHPTAVGHVHDVASALATISIVVAVVCGAVARGGKIGVVSLLLVGSALTADAVLLGIGDPAPGARQRILVAAGCCWQTIWLVALWRERSATGQLRE